MLTEKQRTELMKVHNGEKYSKNWNFWASLCRQGIVDVKSKPRPQYGVASIEITEWGKVVLGI